MTRKRHPPTIKKNPPMNGAPENIGDHVVVPKDLPKLQFKLQYDTPFPEEAKYESIEGFTRKFEKVMYYISDDNENIWKGNLPLCMSLDYGSWLGITLKHAADWTEAKALLFRKSGSVFTEEATRRIYNAFAKANWNNYGIYQSFFVISL